MDNPVECEVLLKTIRLFFDIGEEVMFNLFRNINISKERNEMKDR